MASPSAQPDLRRKPHVLFLGPTNAARTQMAEAYARIMLKDLVEVRSAGMEASELDQRTRAALDSDGVDCSGLYAKELDQRLLDWADVIITLCADTQRLKMRPQDSYVHKNWSVQDPARVARGPDDIGPFHEAMENIKRRIRQYSNSIRLMHK
jgi:arsenate reductase (thioredoxin)